MWQLEAGRDYCNSYDCSSGRDYYCGRYRGSF